MKRSMLFLLAVLSQPLGAAVYQCTGVNGEPLYTDRPCGLDGRGEDFSALSVSGDRRLRHQRRSVSVPIKKKRPMQNRRKMRVSSSRRLDISRCREIDREVDNIESQLRAGYRPYRGVKLRKRRAALEEEHADKCRFNYR